MSETLETLRQQAGDILSKVGTSPSSEQTQQYKAIIDKFFELGGAKEDYIVRIGETFFDYFVKGGSHDRSYQGPAEDDPIDGSKMIEFDYLENFMIESFKAAGTPDKEARVCADVLIEADKRGIDSHGIGRLKPIYLDRIAKGILKPYHPITVIKDSPTTALLDGHMGIGLYIGPHCMELAIQKAKQYGVGFVAVKNSTHYGIAGYYADMACKAGCIGWTGTNARPSIAPTFGAEPCLGTNPLTFGVPTDEEFDFVVDCATSINQRGKIEKYDRLGLPTPKGMVIDSEGRERTDTKQILVDMVKGTCALTPVGGVGDALGGYKGYNWATLVELLSVAFQSGPIGPGLSGIDRETGKPAPMSLGHFFLAIDIESMCDLDTFKHNAGNLMRFIRNSRKDPRGPGRIWTAGEAENDFRKIRKERGGTIVPPILLKEMKELRDTLPGLKEKYPQFPFEK